jgi:hypothetical protein
MLGECGSKAEVQAAQTIGLLNKENQTHCIPVKLVSAPWTTLVKSYSFLRMYFRGKFV